MKNDIELVIFDLGGVLIELTGVPRMLELTQGQFSESDLWEKWLHSPVVRAFESGKITDSEFSEQIVSEFNITVSPEQYLAEFTAWPRGFYPGAKELIARINRNVRVATLSNTNTVHWPRFIHEMKLLEMVTMNFPSHLSGLLKPDTEAFLHVTNQVGVLPSRTLVLDDNGINVDAARKVSMQACRVQGIAETEKCLHEFGLLTDSGN